MKTEIYSGFIYPFKFYCMKDIEIVFLAIVLIFLVLLFLYKRNSEELIPFNVKALNDRGIKFMFLDLIGALTEAKQYNKLLFLCIYSSDNENYKKLQSFSFSDMEVGHMYNEKFINISIDISNEIGKKIAKFYHLSYTPSLLITNSNGIILAKTHGFLIPKELIKFAEFGLSKM